MTVQRMWHGIVRLVPYAARIYGALFRMKEINQKCALPIVEKIDPARKMSRFYAICVTPTLFGQWAVVREW